MLTGLYECPECGEIKFVVTYEVQGRYLIGFCLKCGEHGKLPINAVPSETIYHNDDPEYGFAEVHGW